MCGLAFGDGNFHKFGLALAESKKVLRRLAAEARVVVRFEPVERAGCLRIQPELGAVLHEVSALFGILHHAAGFHFIRSDFDFGRRSCRAVRLQPGADIFILFRGLNGCFELRAVDALETEKHVVQRTIIMIFAQCSCQAGAAFVHGTAGDGESGDTFTRAVRGLFSQISIDDAGIHNGIIFVGCEYCFTNGCESHEHGCGRVPQSNGPRLPASVARRGLAANRRSHN